MIFQNILKFFKKIPLLKNSSKLLFLDKVNTSLDVLTVSLEEKKQLPEGISPKDVKDLLNNLAKNCENLNNKN